MKRNPYREGVEKRTKLNGRLNEVKTKCLGKGGIMFRIFDLGRLGLRDNENVFFVYKNHVGSIIRKFIKTLETEENYDASLQIMRQDLKKLGRFVFEDAEKVQIYGEKIDEILKELE